MGILFSTPTLPTLRNPLCSSPPIPLSSVLQSTPVPTSKPITSELLQCSTLNFHSYESNNKFPSIPPHSNTSLTPYSLKHNHQYTPTVKNVIVNNYVSGLAAAKVGPAHAASIRSVGYDPQDQIPCKDTVIRAVVHGGLAAEDKIAIEISKADGLTVGMDKASIKNNARVVEIHTAGKRKDGTIMKYLLELRELLAGEGAFSILLKTLAHIQDIQKELNIPPTQIWEWTGMVIDNAAEGMGEHNGFAALFNKARKTSYLYLQKEK